VFGSIALEVLIAAALLYVFFSAAVAVFVELLASVLNLRARILAGVVLQWVGDGDARTGQALVAAIYRHPMVAGSIADGGAGPRTHPRRPSCISGRTFVVALLDTLRLRQTKAPAAAGPISADELLGNAASIVRGMEDGPLKRVLALHAGEPPESNRALRLRADQVAHALEGWFDRAVDRAIGRYRRVCGYVTVLAATALAVAIDLDALRLLSSLWSGRRLSAAGDGSAGPLVGFGLGWDGAGAFAARLADPGPALSSVLGWLVSGLVLSLGAAIWFDTLGRSVGLRAGVPPPPRSEPRA
jgi:hypothetical protein